MSNRVRDSFLKQICKANMKGNTEILKVTTEMVVKGEVTGTKPIDFQHVPIHVQVRLRSGTWARS